MNYQFHIFLFLDQPAIGSFPQMRFDSFTTCRMMSAKAGATYSVPLWSSPQEEEEEDNYKLYPIFDLILALDQEHRKKYISKAFLVEVLRFNELLSKL